MIHSVKCDKPSFKDIEFQAGFNVILAERTKESTKKDSRNGLGKSTLIEIIHFCLGGNKGETLKKAELKDWSFTLDLDLGNKRYSITRNTLKEGKIIIDGDCSGWPVKPEIDKNTGEQILSVREWTKVLGVLMFGLQYSYPDRKIRPDIQEPGFLFRQARWKTRRVPKPISAIQDPEGMGQAAKQCFSARPRMGVCLEVANPKRQGNGH